MLKKPRFYIVTFLDSLIENLTIFVDCSTGGRDGIRTHVPLEGDNRISSAGRYNHFDTLPLL